MATPATDVLDCRFLHEKMKAWDCAGDLEKFILQYKKHGSKKNPESWEEFVQGRNDYGIAVNLVASRTTMPMDIHRFRALLETLVFTNGSDKDLVSRIYEKVFKALFASKDIEVMDFHGLGWAFPVNEFADAALSFCGDRLRILNLADNQLEGDVNDVLRPLVVLEECDLSNNTQLGGALVRLPSTLRSFKASLCRKLSGLFL